MNNTLIAVIIAILIGLGAFWYLNRQSIPQMQQPAENEEQTSTPTIPTASTVILSEQNDSGITGQAILSTVGSETVIMLTLEGAPEGVSQPAHIHVGSCADIGGIAYPLTSTTDGASQTVIAMPLETILLQQPLAINVHKSDAEANIYVACGNVL